jgi:hypothetical protein
MAGFFLPQVLDEARVLMLHGLRVENPPFYPSLAVMGFSNLPNFSQMATTTFGDMVVSHVAFTDGLLFHELVHVEQYRQLGIPRFSGLYVRGFLSGGGYRNGQFDQFLVPEVPATTPNAPIGFSRQVNHC